MSWKMRFWVFVGLTFLIKPLHGNLLKLLNHEAFIEERLSHHNCRDHVDLITRLSYLTDYMSIVKIMDNINVNEYRQHILMFRLLQNTSVDPYMVVTIKTLDTTYEEKNYTLAEQYSWQGNKFEERTITRSAPDYSAQAKGCAEDRHVAQLIFSTPSVLNDYLTGMPRCPFFKNTNSEGIVIIIFDETDKGDPILQVIIDKLWKDYGNWNVVFLFDCATAEFAYYDPFKPTANGSWGMLKYSHFKNSDQLTLNRFQNFHEFPIAVSMFERYPTALKANRLPRMYFNDPVLKSALNYSSGIGGLDGILLAALVLNLNFTANINGPTDGIEYGHKTQNGTFTGTFGDLLYRRADIAFNGCFMTDYDTDELDFLFPIYFDKMCIIAPKALKIPQWILVFQCFSVKVWILLVIFNTSCGCFWYALTRIYKLVVASNVAKDETSELNRCFGIFVEMWMVLLSAPSSQIPQRNAERLFMTACLLFNLIISGVFQGSLTTSFSTTSYYKDINTLEELDKSGLFIGTSSRGLSTLFANDTSPLYKSLGSKFFFLKNQAAIDRASKQRDMCAIQRLSDVKLIINDIYTNRDGTPMLRPIPECPRSYHLSYAIKKGWPFTEIFHEKLRRLYEAGLLHKWYTDTESAIITEKKIKEPLMDRAWQTALTLADIQTPFYIFVVGNSVAAVILAFEIVAYKFFGIGRLMH